VAGRIDNAAHDASVARASGVVPYKDEIRFQLDQILASGAFRGSHRCQEFLSHVVEHALSGDFDGIKERMLGIRIFGRKASFDTNYDSIVRVTASDVRKRLLRYYETSPSSTLRIELPLGSYIPEFHHAIGRSAYSSEARSVASSVADSSESEELHRRSLETGSSISGEPAVIAEHGEDARGKTGNALPSSSAPPIRLRFFLLTGAICLLFFIVGWIVSGFHTRAALHRDLFTIPQYSFYGELLGPLGSNAGQETKIVLSNPSVFLPRESDSPNPLIDEDRGRNKVLIPPHVARNLAGGVEDTKVGLPHRYLSLDTTDYTGLGEAQTAFNLQKLFDMLNRSAELTEGRFLNWDEARDQNLVLLGARHVTPWTQSDIAAANFTMEFKTTSNAIDNLHPKPGEQATYVQKFDGRELVDYGLIWMSQSPSGSRILVLAGLTSTGTAGVGDFFTDPNQMKPIFEKLKAASPKSSIPPNWQVLLRITARDDVPLNVSFVALRVSPGNE
jgi:hypothetical protein